MFTNLPQPTAGALIFLNAIPLEMKMIYGTDKLSAKQ